MSNISSMRRRQHDSRSAAALVGFAPSLTSADHAIEPAKLLHLGVEQALKQYELFRDYVKHEDNLINQRLTWVLTVQGFLFAAYGLSVQKRVEVAEKLATRKIETVSEPALLLNGEVPSTALGHIERTLGAQLGNSLFQLDFLMYLLLILGLLISSLGRSSIRAAEQSLSTLVQVYEGGIAEKIGDKPWWYVVHCRKPGSITVEQIVLPVMAGGGGINTLRMGFAAARNIPSVLIGAWVLIFAVQVVVSVFGAVAIEATISSLLSYL